MVNKFLTVLVFLLILLLFTLIGFYFPIWYFETFLRETHNDDGEILAILFSILGTAVGFCFGLILGCVFAFKWVGEKPIEE